MSYDDCPQLFFILEMNEHLRSLLSCLIYGDRVLIDLRTCDGNMVLVQCFLIKHPAFVCLKLSLSLHIVLEGLFS